jgi:F-type H+-transporting ATPase subunit alpha
MKKVAGTLRLDLSQFRELQSFAQFGSDLDKATQDTLARGERTLAILKQSELNPLPVEEQVALLFAINNGYVDGIETEQVPDYESQLLDYLRDRHGEVLAAIRDEKEVSDETNESLKNALSRFNESYEPRESGGGLVNVSGGEDG